MLEAVIIAILVTIDQLTKSWATKHLFTLENKTMPVIKDILNFTYVENTGASFNLAQGKTVLLLVFSTLALLLLVFVLLKFRSRTSVFLRIILSMFISGGLGNLIDRARMGYVVDFIEFKFVNFAVFNFADICAVLAIVFFLIYIFFTKDGKELMNDEFWDGKPNTNIDK